MPERAAGSVPILHPPLRRLPPRAAPRPFVLLPRPEEIGAMAELPDYPPRRFSWRRVHYLVVKAQGPEQIAGEWWRGGTRNAPSRDYYVVEVETRTPFLDLSPRSLRWRWCAAALVPAWNFAVSRYSELVVASNFSFLQGASHPEELIVQAKSLGLGAIALCDRNSVAERRTGPGFGKGALAHLSPDLNIE